MKLQDMTLQQLKEIVDGAPEGAEFKFGEKYGKDWRANLDDPEIDPKQYPWRYALWCGATQSWNDSIFVGEDYSGLFLNLSDIRTRIDEFEPKQKYDWSNVPEVVNWLATDKDGDCAWGFLEEPVIELEDGEWRPVAPYTEIYINGSNGTVAAYKGDWQESLEQRKFKIGDKVTFIRNIEPFQWGAKEKVYEVVDVADNLPTSTDQRVWLDTTASSPHLSRNLCLATAIGQVGIEDLPIHGEPISSEIITNAPMIDELEAQKDISVTLSAESIKNKGVEQSETNTALDNEAALFNEPLTECELKAPAGLKHDQNKLRYSLIPAGALEAIVGVLEYGATKYAPNNWKHVENARERYYNASMRHIQAWWPGEQNDPETSLPHLAHAACSLMFLMWLDGGQGE